MIYPQLVYVFQIIRQIDSAKMVSVYITIIKFISEQAPQHFPWN